ncbi:MAG TPA: TVP38/TMEM64 family protein [Burkholderiales bacterium]|nr:TVP38/TMEM64 family protein [Burkholderiales bacterium]
MRATASRFYAAIACAALLVAAGLWAWQAQPLSIEAVLGILQRHARDPAAPLTVALVYVVAGFALVPVMALIAVTGLAFGPVMGALYALFGALASGACSYALGRYFGAPLMSRYASARVDAVRSRLEARGLWAVILIRLVPAGPYTLVNAVAGASGIRPVDFLVGTAIGMTPGIIATVGVVHGARMLWPGLSH